MTTSLLSLIRAYLARMTADPDRGDSPVPTAIIIAGLAVLALGILIAANAAIDGWTALIPGADQAPDNT